MKKGSFALRLFLYASLVSLIWLGGYVILSEVFSVKVTIPEKPTETETPGDTLPNPVSAQWSVLAVVDEEKEVTEFLFRYADFLADTLVFVNVPTNTKAELAAGGYEVLSVHNPELPELFMISDLCRIFSEETWCMAAEEAGAALLGIRPKECYFLEEATYDSLTERVDGIRRFKNPDSVKDTVFTVTEHAVTNDSAETELLYWESYLDLDDIYYVTLPGEALAEEYRPDYSGIQSMTERFRLGVFREEDEKR